MAVKDSRNARSNRLVLGTLLLLVGGGIAVWFLRPNPVELGDDGYKVAMALYNACNQKDSDKIAALATILGDSVDSHSANSHSANNDRSGELQIQTAGKQALMQIIDLAEAGDWTEASAECRQIMNDQVK